MKILILLFGALLGFCLACRNTFDAKYQVAQRQQLLASATTHCCTAPGYIYTVAWALNNITYISYDHGRLMLQNTISTANDYSKITAKTDIVRYKSFSSATISVLQTYLIIPFIF